MLIVVLAVGKQGLAGKRDIHGGVIEQSEQMALAHVFKRHQCASQIQIEFDAGGYSVFMCVHDTTLPLTSSLIADWLF